MTACWYEAVWTDEVGTIDVCQVHGNNSRHEESTDPHRPCVTVDPWPTVLNHHRCEVSERYGACAHVGDLTTHPTTQEETP